MRGYKSKNHSEIGAVRKDWGGKVPVAIVYPNSYYIGMSNLAVHLLYKTFNDDLSFVAERVFLSEDKILSEENKRPLSDFKMGGFTFSFETDYLNIPKIFGKDIPLLRKERDNGYPVLFAGGPAVTMNPDALSEIFDVIVVGEVECVIEKIMAHLKEEREKQKLLEKLAVLPGLFVPGISKSGKTERLLVENLDKCSTHSVIWTDDSEFGHMHLVETARGCPWKCRFCATPALYSPYRIRSRESIWAAIEYGLSYRKHVGLIGSDVLDHPSFKEIAEGLIEKGIKVSTSSLRTNRIDKDIARLFVKSGHKRATLGIEAGTEGLRKKIDKTLTEAAIFRAVKNLAEAGITNLKLYFMTGLPGETEEDLKGIASLTSEIRKIVLKERKLKTMSPNISVVATPFVPKKSTPFEKEEFAGREYLTAANKMLSRLINKIPNTSLKGEPPKKGLLEYKLSHAGPTEIFDFLKDY